LLLTLCFGLRRVGIAAVSNPKVALPKVLGDGDHGSDGNVHRHSVVS
jgi:hypothetical protein